MAKKSLSSLLYTKALKLNGGFTMSRLPFVSELLEYMLMRTLWTNYFDLFLQ